MCIRDRSMTVAGTTKKTNQAALLNNKPPTKNKAKLASGKDTLVSTWLPRVASMMNVIAEAITIGLT